MSWWAQLKHSLQHERSAWLVGTVFIVLLVAGFVWRGLYLYFLDQQHEQQVITEQLIKKSTLLEEMIISARNRSVLLSEMLFQPLRENRFNELKQRFDAEVHHIVRNRMAYEAIADAYEAELMNRYLELTSMNRIQQDYVVDLLDVSDRQEAIYEYIRGVLPLQEQALSALDQVHAYTVNMRLINRHAIEQQSLLLRNVVAYSTLLYLLVFAIVAFLVIRRLLSMNRLQVQLQTQLSEQLQEKTMAYNQVDKELVRLAHYDTVTNLVNRRYFEQCLEDYLSRYQQVSLLFVDLDNFKWFNDTLGHASGDELLRRFAERLTSHQSPIDYALIGRLGGDEFAIILAEAIPELEQIAAEFLFETIADLDSLYKPAKTLGLSVGIARFPEHAQQSDLLMRFADMAMYHAKSLGKGQMAIFDASLLQKLYDELDLEQALKQALTAGHIQVFYQAQYCLQTLALTGAEALVRWQRFGQWVSPTLLIPIAEKTGIIHELGLVVLDQVLMDMQTWDAQACHLPKVAVNISAVQMRLDNLHESFVSRIQDSGIAFTRIEAEITESSFADMDVCATFIQHLAERDMGIALDDFGTGYSSLSQITRLNVDKLKIDQSFVARIEDDVHTQVLVKTIIQMGHNLGLTVLAEGIETYAQYCLLKAWGCDEGQGYLFARPVAADQFSFTPLDEASWQCSEATTR